MISGIVFGVVSGVLSGEVSGEGSGDLFGDITRATSIIFSWQLSCLILGLGLPMKESKFLECSILVV